MSGYARRAYPLQAVTGLQRALAEAGQQPINQRLQRRRCEELQGTLRLRRRPADGLLKPIIVLSGQSGVPHLNDEWSCSRSRGWVKCPWGEAGFPGGREMQI